MLCNTWLTNVLNATIEWEGLGRGKLPDVDISQRSIEDYNQEI
jgi:hypothetical protein